MNNGTVLKVHKLNRLGEIEAVKESTSKKTVFKLNRDHGNFDYAYATTSYSSQGKTVDKVIIAQPAITFPASNQKQFYVSVSRGRESVHIYTDDKEQLLNHIEKSGDRQGATELMNGYYYKTKEVEIDTDKNKEVLIDKLKEYEPEI